MRIEFVTCRGGLELLNTQVYHYDAFTKTPNMGNPAGVVINADHLDNENMLEIAKKLDLMRLCLY